MARIYSITVRQCLFWQLPDTCQQTVYLYTSHPNLVREWHPWRSSPRWYFFTLGCFQWFTCILKDKTLDPSQHFGRAVSGVTTCANVFWHLVLLFAQDDGTLLAEVRLMNNASMWQAKVEKGRKGQGEVRVTTDRLKRPKKCKKKTKPTSSSKIKEEDYITHFCQIRDNFRQTWAGTHTLRRL